MEDSHTLSQHCLENQAPCASAELRAVEVNMLLIYTADGFLSEEETLKTSLGRGKEGGRPLRV